MKQHKEAFKNICISIVSLVIINLIFIPLPVFWKELLLGKSKLELILTFQDIMWFMFTIGLLMIFKSLKKINIIKEFQKIDYLPESFEVIFDDELLTEVIKKTKTDSKEKYGILPYMILQICLQFRTNNSISITADFLSKQIDLFLHGIELNYNKLKYIIWLIPSLGFMGTVYGIGVAVSQLGSGSLDDPDLLTKMAGSLGVAFNTTLLALILSVILQFLSQHFEAEEETLINSFGKYIMDNLINKLVEKR